jgi:hypothetical protein
MGIPHLFGVTPRTTPEVEHFTARRPVRYLYVPPRETSTVEGSATITGREREAKSSKRRLRCAQGLALGPHPLRPREPESRAARGLSPPSRGASELRCLCPSRARPTPTGAVRAHCLAIGRLSRRCRTSTLPAAATGRAPRPATRRRRLRLGATQAKKRHAGGRANSRILAHTRQNSAKSRRTRNQAKRASMPESGGGDSDSSSRSASRMRETKWPAPNCRGRVRSNRQEEDCR